MIVTGVETFNLMRMFSWVVVGEETVGIGSTCYRENRDRNEMDDWFVGSLRNRMERRDGKPSKKAYKKNGDSRREATPTTPISNLSH